MSALASPLGAVVGLVMGALGGGGSLIAIPILVYVVGQDARAAQATALVIVCAGAGSGIASYLRDDDVRWRAGIVFGLAAGVSAFAGSVLNQRIDQDVLLLAFAPVMLLGAVAMVSERAREPARFRPWRFGVGAAEAARVIALGLAIGWLIGLFGVGGGFLIVPALVLALHLSMVEAVGTSLLVILIGSGFALGDRIASGDVDWSIALPFSLAALLGALAGRRLAASVDEEALRRTFAALVVGAALYMGIDSALALA
jgi:uncharacterized membrane protein YfcA